MSKPAKLIPLPAASATKTALVINQRATDKELTELGHALAHIEGSRSWWMGDYGLELQRRKRKELKTLNPKLTDDELDAGSRHYIGDRAEALAVDAANWHNCTMVARFYDTSVRTEISFGHHYVAMGAVGARGDVKKAIAWLLTAAEKGWSVSQLRGEVNRALATGAPIVALPEANPFAPMDEADHWAGEHKETALTPELARACLTRFAGLIAFIERLKEEAAKAQP